MQMERFDQLAIAGKRGARAGRALRDDLDVNLARAIITGISRKCLYEGKSPRDCVGVVIEVPVPERGRSARFSFTLTKKMALAMEEDLKAEDKKILNGTSEGPAPKGIMSVMG